MSCIYIRRWQLEFCEHKWFGNYCIMLCVFIGIKVESNALRLLIGCRVVGLMDRVKNSGSYS